MTTNTVGKISRLDPRSIWPKESNDFTRWLSEEENFATLCEALNLIDAEFEGREVSVGDFSADIVGKDRDGQIIVENQLEQTDHRHLGQLITYLAPIDEEAKVIWISTRVREEHRAAIDWLNEHTSERYSFFAVELELLSIESSRPAPMFHVISKPNSWTRHATARSMAAANQTTTERQKRYLSFWTEMANHFDLMDQSFRGSKPPKDHWWQFPTGKSGFSITLTAGARDGVAGVEMYIHNDPENEYFDFFHRNKEKIDGNLGPDIEWEPLEGKKGSRIIKRIHGVDPFEPIDSSRLKDFYWSNILAFQTTFLPLLREID
jgi:hypothetical protein